MKRLYRSTANHILGGVCGGLGDYFRLDPVLIRLVWLILILFGAIGFLFGGIGLILYIIAWVIIPLEEEAPAKRTPPEPRGVGKGRFWWGLVLVAMGAVLWGSQFRFIYWSIIPGVHLQSRDVVPLVLVLVGIYILYTFGRAAAGKGWLFRSRDDRKLVGVCGGVAEYFQIDATLVRVLWVAGVFFFHGAAILVYLVLMVALPDKPDDSAVETTDSKPKD